MNTRDLAIVQALWDDQAIEGSLFGALDSQRACAGLGGFLMKTICFGRKVGACRTVCRGAFSRNSSRRSLELVYT